MNPSFIKYDISLPLPQFYEAVIAMKKVLGKTVRENRNFFILKNSPIASAHSL
jgi:hypothetical protein